jgi:hypothetical protein
MTNTKPQITLLQPTVLPDNRRVTFNMAVSNLPPMINAFFTMPDSNNAPPASPDPNSITPGPYPNIELSILNSQRQQIASLLIVEHKEERSALTLHLPAVVPRGQYTARAEMTYQDEIIDAVEILFAVPAGD